MTPIIPGSSPNTRPSSDASADPGAILAEYRWLVSAAAERWIEIAANADAESLVRTTLALRKDLGALRTHLVVAQAELRRRAAVKFPAAPQMFFTRQLLEQATDAQVAACKAARWSEAGLIADLCCGIGGDLLALAGQGPVVGVDRDPVAALLAAANCERLGRTQARVQVEDVRDANLAQFASWHMDPDRRVEGRRNTAIERYEPDLEAIDRLLDGNGRAALKLAPAARVPQHWARDAELEWIGNRGECRQQIVWFPALARNPGKRSATVFAAGAAEPRSICGDPERDAPEADAVGHYVYDPHSAVVAADLTGALAAEHALHCVSAKSAYLTGDRVVTDPALACFEVLEILPVDPKHLRDAIRERGIGRLEVKKRGVKIDPEEVRKQIHPRGDNCATLIISPVRSKVAAILARRIGGSEADGSTEDREDDYD